MALLLHILRICVVWLLEVYSMFLCCNIIRMLFIRRQADYTLGIFQSIGFKEFHEYLTLSEECRQSEAGVTLLRTGNLHLQGVLKFSIICSCLV